MINQTEIVELEQKFWKAMKDEDLETTVSLTRFPCVLSGPQGTRLVTEDDFRSMMKNVLGDSLKDVELKNTLVEILNEDAAVITYEAMMDGKNMLDVSTWVRDNGNWVCAFHSENPKLQ